MDSILHSTTTLGVIFPRTWTKVGASQNSLRILGFLSSFHAFSPPGLFGPQTLGKYSVSCRTQVRYAPENACIRAGMFLHILLLLGIDENLHPNSGIKLLVYFYFFCEFFGLFSCFFVVFSEVHICISKYFSHKFHMTAPSRRLSRRNSIRWPLVWTEILIRIQGVYLEVAISCEIA